MQQKFFLSFLTCSGARARVCVSLDQYLFIYYIYFLSFIENNTFAHDESRKKGNKKRKKWTITYAHITHDFNIQAIDRSIDLSILRSIDRNIITDNSTHSTVLVLRTENS